MNILKTFLLLGALSALAVFLGNVFAGNTGMLIMLFISLAINFFSYWYSDKIVLKMSGAQPLKKSEMPEIFNMVEEITHRANLPMPKLYMTNDMQPNAFATGRNPDHASVAVTAGLVQLLDKNEIKGVLAHEIAHIKNRDILIGSIAAMFAAVISYAANIFQWTAIFGGSNSDDEESGSGNMISSLALAIIAPIAALLIQMAISRSREYLADETGARLVNDSGGLSNALLKLEKAAHHVPLAHANPSTAHMYISNPLRGGGLFSLFSTHPATKDRVAKLTALPL